ncbi:uncharacterized protein [Dysidea avara]|uniref:uncharacterized protein isoform X2 n=1 Tax=Dysidea avara TaxID=196820 RepID=UPI003330B971
MFTCSPPPEMLHGLREPIPSMDTIGFRVVNCSWDREDEGVTDVGQMGTAIRIGSDVLTVFWDNGTIASYQCDGSLNLGKVPIATGVHFSVGYDDHPLPVFDDQYGDITRLQQSCELIDEFTVQVGCSDPALSLMQVAEVDITKTKNNTTIECKPHEECKPHDYCTEAEKKCCHNSEYLTVLPAYISSNTDTKAAAASLFVKCELKGSNYQSIHPIILHDHNYI